MGRVLSKAEIDLLIEVMGEQASISHSESPLTLSPQMSEQIGIYHDKLQLLIDQLEGALSSLDKKRSSS